MSILKVENLQKTFGRRRVVDGVSLNVHRGEIVGLLGPNGAGKSTTFKMICGLLNPDRGNVTLDGNDVTKWPMFERARSGGMGYLPQQSSIFGKLSVQQNLLMVMQLLKMSRKEQKRRCDELLQQFKIEKLRKSKASKLSGGERRRLEIARCLVSNPEIIMLDEPFAGIDPVTVQSIRGVIEDLRDSGIAILITDHAADQVLQTTDRTYVVSEGRILCSGTAEEIVQHEEVKRKYLGEIEFSRDSSSRSAQSVKALDETSTDSALDEDKHVEVSVSRATKQAAPTREVAKPVSVQLPKQAAPTESMPSISFGASELTGAIDSDDIVMSDKQPIGESSRVDSDAGSARSRTTGRQVASPFRRVKDEIEFRSQDVKNRTPGSVPEPLADNSVAEEPVASNLKQKRAQRKAARRKDARVVEPRVARNISQPLQQADAEPGTQRIVLESDPEPQDVSSETRQPTGSTVRPKPGIRKPVLGGSRADAQPQGVNAPKTTHVSSPVSSPAEAGPVVFEEVADAVEKLSESAEESAKRVRSAIKRPKINKVAQFRKIKAPFTSDDIDGQ